MEYYDLGLSFVWEYDDDFINLIENACHKKGLTTFRIGYYNFTEVYNRIVGRDINFRFYLDRGWDVDEGFEMMGKIISRKKTIIFNPYKKVLHAIDKASMHLEFITHGLIVPYSIIIPPHSETEEIFISVEDLARLGRPFIIKPCNTTGGGVGVVTGAESLMEVIEQRMTNTNDKYLLQEKIYPKNLNGKRAWFRCFWAFGKPIPVWWDDQTHLYTELTSEEIAEYNLKKLNQITRNIARLIELDFFSTEIVLTENDNFVVIDYVNDQCDMRLKSKHADGVPDQIIMEIIDGLTRSIIKQKKILFQ
jgi:hypothetical protein